MVDLHHPERVVVYHTGDPAAGPRPARDGAPRPRVPAARADARTHRRLRTGDGTHRAGEA